MTKRTVLLQADWPPSPTLFRAAARLLVAHEEEGIPLVLSLLGPRDARTFAEYVSKANAHSCRAATHLAELLLDAVAVVSPQSGGSPE